MIVGEAFRPFSPTEAVSHARGHRAVGASRVPRRRLGCGALVFALDHVPHTILPDLALGMRLYQEICVGRPRGHHTQRQPEGPPKQAGHPLGVAPSGYPGTAGAQQVEYRHLSGVGPMCERGWGPVAILRQRSSGLRTRSMEGVAARSGLPRVGYPLGLSPGYPLGARWEPAGERPAASLPAWFGWRGGSSQAPERERPAQPIPAESDPERVGPACVHRRRSAELHLKGSAELRPLSKIRSVQIHLLLTHKLSWPEGHRRG